MNTNLSEWFDKVAKQFEGMGIKSLYASRMKVLEDTDNKNRYQIIIDVQTDRQTGKTFRTIMQALYLASGGETVIVECRDVESAMHFIGECVSLCRRYEKIDSPYKSCDMLDIVSAYLIEFVGGGSIEAISSERGRGVSIPPSSIVLTDY